MEPVTYKAFRDGMRSQIWPSPPGEPKNLRSSHDDYFQDAMHEMSKTIKCLQSNNVDVRPACSTYVQCAKTVVDPPIGMITRVYTIANDEWCDPVIYLPSNFTEIDAWARNLMIRFTSPTNANLPALKQGFKFTEASTDIEYGRARIGQWALHRNRLYVAPWIQSTESLVIEWQGVKQTWKDDDMLDLELWDRHVRSAIMAYVRSQHELYYGCDRNKMKDMEDTFMKQRARAYYECDKRTREQEEEFAREVTPRYPLSAEVTDDEPIAETSIVIANIGDFANPDNGTAEQDVADLVTAWSPEIIVSNGGNHYGSPAAYSTKVGTYYGAYITGNLQTTKFFPAIGWPDWDNAGLSAYQSYFTLPNNERYYDFVSNGVHFFVLHTGIPDGGDGSTSNETDGHTSTSAQAEWLRVKLSLSTARWKVVIMYDPPYTSETTDAPGFTQLRWDFRTWGADAVISARGHVYERQIVSGLPYFINGLGGAGLGTFDLAPAATSLARYNSNYGALKLTVLEDSLTFEFYDIDATLIDEYELTK